MGGRVNAPSDMAHEAVSAMLGTVLVATKTAGAVAAHARVYRTYSEIGIGHISEPCGERHPFRSQHSGEELPLSGAVLLKAGCEDGASRDVAALDAWHSFGNAQAHQDVG